MRYTLANKADKHKLRLQSIGEVIGTPAGEIKKGDTLMWNFGGTELVTDIVRETDKMLIINVLCDNVLRNDVLYVRKLLKTRLVCILK